MNEWEVRVAIQQTDLWGDIQRSTWRAPGGSNVRVLPTSTLLHICATELDWHTDRHHRRADELLTSLEAAVGAGRTHKAARLRAAWLAQLQADRIACAKDVARQRGLRLDPIGRGPLVTSPTIHYRDRLPWTIRPIDRHDPATVPDRAASVIAVWNGSGRLFDQLYVANEPVSTAEFPVSSLIGAISPDGRTAEWFTLDRWAS